MKDAKIFLGFAGALVGIALLVKLAHCKAGVAFWFCKSHPSDQLPTDQVHMSDPGASLANDDQPLDSPNTDPITEAAYHQASVTHAPALGDNENVGGEEVLTVQ